MAKRNLKILIAGGGIGGITALLALRQRGIEAELFEQAEAFRQVGAGLQVSNNATRVLRTLGLGDALARVTYYPEGRDYRAWDTGDRLYYTPLGERAEARFGAPYYTAHRADLLDVLLGGLGREGFRLGSRIERFEQHADRVTITLADGSTATGDILIGADGIHSTVRRTFNWIGISRSEQPARESWLAEGRVEDALAEYSGWHDTIRTIIKETPKLLRQALYDREPLCDWQIGRVVLLGDAAHPMMPFYAQGAAQSIEDAYVLAGCLAASQDDPVAALARYVKLRQPRTAWMQGLARREEELYQMNDAATIAERNARMRTNRIPESANFPPEQERLYGYDAEAVLHA
jgi:salicylate hydroxylase